MVTSPRVGSKTIWVIPASSGTMALTSLSARASSSLTEGSDRTTILFLIRRAISATMKPCSTRTSGLFV